MRFTKMQGCGNDYVYVDCFAQKPPANASALLSRLARHGLVRRLARGRWAIGVQPTRDQLAEQVAAPSPVAEIATFSGSAPFESSLIGTSAVATKPIRM